MDSRMFQNVVKLDRWKTLNTSLSLPISSQCFVALAVDQVAKLPTCPPASCGYCRHCLHLSSKVSAVRVCRKRGGEITPPPIGPQRTSPSAHYPPFSAPPQNCVHAKLSAQEESQLGNAMQAMPFNAGTTECPEMSGKCCKSILFSALSGVTEPPNSKDKMASFGQSTAPLSAQSEG